MTEQKFGKNFKDNLLAAFDEHNMLEAEKFITHYLEETGLNQFSFLDAGCGHGVFSIAAARLGATVTAFDIDVVALENAQALAQQFLPRAESITLLKGDITDERFMDSLGTFDRVLCWGVTHHTGQLWHSLELVSRRVAPKGKVHLGIYNTADGWGFYPDGRFGPSSFWTKVKRMYVSLPGGAQVLIDKLATCGIVMIYLLTFNNPVKKLRANERRGMNWKSDLKDWLIGYPYEHATPEQVFEFMKTRGFVLEKIKTNNGLLTNNYVFKKG